MYKLLINGIHLSEWIMDKEAMRKQIATYKRQDKAQGRKATYQMILQEG